MKLRNKLAAITAAAMLAFTGVGFAAWHFTNTVNNDNAVVDGRVTAAIEAHELKVQDGNGHDIDGLYLICDAPAGQTNLVAANGIYWSTEEDGKDDSGAKSEITTLTLIGSVNVDDANDIQDIASYVGTFTSTATAAHNGPYVNIPATSALNTPVTSTTKSADVSTTFTLPVPAYALVPTNVAQVEALQAEVDALSLTFAFEFSVTTIA